jgi:hypothetical protein
MNSLVSATSPELSSSTMDIVNDTRADASEKEQTKVKRTQTLRRTPDPAPDVGEASVERQGRFLPSSIKNWKGKYPLFVSTKSVKNPEREAEAGRRPPIIGDETWEPSRQARP